MKRVLNLSTSPSVFLISLIAKLAESPNPRDSISFSIGGSGTHLNVNRAKQYHQIPDEAMQNGIIQSPSRSMTIARCTTNRRPPPRYP